MGMSNYNKNLFVGLGGKDAIDLSHFIGACYGMERMMGKADNPLRRILNRAADDFLQKLPLVRHFLSVIIIDSTAQARAKGFASLKYTFMHGMVLAHTWH